MATIHRIEPLSARQSQGRPGERQASSAQIILFPGVRYERWSENQQTSSAAKCSRKQRDRLDIAD